MKSLSLAGLAALGILACPLLMAAQTDRELGNHASQASYEDVVDRIFEFSRTSERLPKGLQRRIVLRFLPAWGPESQIVILDKGERVFRVVRYSLRDGSPSIYDAYLQGNSILSVEGIIGRTRCDKLEGDASHSLVLLIEDLSRLSIPTGLNTALTLDGTTYELWVQTLSNELHATFSDGAYGEATDSTPIIQWIKAVRREVEEIELE